MRDKIKLALPYVTEMEIDDIIKSVNEGEDYFDLDDMLKALKGFEDFAHDLP